MNQYLKFSDTPNHLEKMINSVKRAYIIPKNMIGGVAVDVGANVGAFPLVNHDKFLRIICIEPSKESCDKIIANMKNNNINNVEVYRYGVSDTSNKTLRLYPHKNSNYSGNATTIEISDAYDFENYEEVMSISLEDIFIKFNLSRINYLKCDCELSEIPFLLEKDILNIDYIGIEHHRAEDSETKKLIEYMSKYFNVISAGSGDEFLYTNKLIK